VAKVGQKERLAVKIAQNPSFEDERNLLSVSAKRTRCIVTLHTCCSNMIDTYRERK